MMSNRLASRFLKKLPELVAEKLADRDPEDHRMVLIFAQDEGRLGRISETRRAWSPMGTRPPAPRLILIIQICPPDINFWYHQAINMVDQERKDDQDGAV
ncbi:MAG: hypothetical protein PHW74_12925 [Desulfobacca sp.]|nr:hypothetical protein [Desulfobacca sp.]